MSWNVPGPAESFSKPEYYINGFLFNSSSLSMKNNVT